MRPFRSTVAAAAGVAATLTLTMSPVLVTPIGAQAAPTSNQLVTAVAEAHTTSLKATMKTTGPKAWKKLATTHYTAKLTKKQKKKGHAYAARVLKAALLNRHPDRVRAGTYSWCNPVNSRHFCTPINDPTWKQWTEDGVNWSLTHTDKDDRRPVPYPGKGMGTGVKLGFVYVITWQPKSFIGPLAPQDPKTVWKFGETARDNWEERAGESWAVCSALSTRVCHLNLLAVADPLNGKYWARWVEASVTKLWNIRVGGGRKHKITLWGFACPPGQIWSCR